MGWRYKELDRILTQLSDIRSDCEKAGRKIDKKVHNPFYGVECCKPYYSEYVRYGKGKFRERCLNGVTLTFD